MVKSVYLHVKSQTVVLREMSVILVKAGQIHPCYDFIVIYGVAL